MIAQWMTLIGCFIPFASAYLNPTSEYTNRWVAHIEGGDEVAQHVCRTLGFTYNGRLGEIKDFYELVKEGHPPLSTEHSEYLTRNLLNMEEVKWAKQQQVSRTVLKDISANEIDEETQDKIELITYMRNEARRLANDPKGKHCKNIFHCIQFPKKFIKLFKHLDQGNISQLGSYSTKPFPHQELTGFTGPTRHIVMQSWKISAYELEFNDPLWTKQWYLQDYRTDSMPVMDHNIVPVYRMGYTGKGVTVAVVDTAIQVDHPDLMSNIDIDASFDMCLNQPLSQITHHRKIAHSHGTECAGVIGMVANNNRCGVGVAYGAKIAAITKVCDDKPTTDEDAARSVVQNLKMIDIYSLSWGADDDAATVCALGETRKRAYEMGVKEGRGGQGVIYIHSAGNGGLLGDNCATDCNINQPNVIAITSANQYGKRSDYAETCTAIFATTYSGNSDKYMGKNLEENVALRPGGKCTTHFFGTSATCPIASGIVALTLEANPNLTYRDMMHIIARTAEVAPLADNDSWKRNGQGLWISEEFGFGLLNAENMVTLAEKWLTVPERHTCTVNIRLDEPKPLDYEHNVSLPIETDGCHLSDKNRVVYLEHLEVTPLAEYPCRGDIQVFITSPTGTKSTLLKPRTKDKDKDGLEGWPIMSVHNWGENPQGVWTLDIEIANGQHVQQPGWTGSVKEVTVKFHGMGERPERLEVPRQYAAFRLPDGVTDSGSFAK